MLEKMGRIKVKLCEDGGGYGDGDDHCLAGASASDVDWQERIATDVGSQTGSNAEKGRTLPADQVAEAAAT